MSEQIKFKTEKKLIEGLAEAASEQGKSEHQEDRFIVSKKEISPKESGWLLSVMDGHGGSKVSQYLKDNLEKVFDEEVAKNENGKVDLDTLKRAFASLNTQTQDIRRAGSTLALVYISETQSAVFVAVIGDSVVFIKEYDGEVNISPEHNVLTNESERREAVNRGGYYNNDSGYIMDSKGSGLMLSRSMGDADMGSIISKEPDLYSRDLGPNSFVAVGSDGIIGHQSSGESGPKDRIINMLENGASPEDLVKDALKRETGDNVTAIIWRDGEL